MTIVSFRHPAELRNVIKNDIAITPCLSIVIQDVLDITDGVIQFPFVEIAAIPFPASSHQPGVFLSTVEDRRLDLVAYLFPAAAFAVGAFFLWRVSRRHRGPLANLLIFSNTLFPVLGFFNLYPFRYSYVADHFAYLAILGILFPIASFALQRTRQPDRFWPSYSPS